MCKEQGPEKIVFHTKSQGGGLQKASAGGLQREREGKAGEGNESVAFQNLQGQPHPGQPQAVPSKLRTNSPRSSPKPSAKTGRKKSPAKKTSKARSKTTKTVAKRKPLDELAPENERREYDDVFNSFMNLKHGSNRQFSEVVANAMDATDNILTLSSAQKQSSRHKVKNKEASKVGQTNKRDKLFELIDELSKQTTDSQGLDKQLDRHTIMQLVNAMSPDSKNNSNHAGVKGDAGNHIALSEPEGPNVNNGESVAEGAFGGDAETSDDRPKAVACSDDRKKKLISGKCTKPDESDIQMVVKFAHEKLDSKHVQEKVFDKLSFNLLIAGELEIISMEGISDLERRARTNIAKTLCYHKKYLGDHDLRSGYDDILKQVEQGVLHWSDDLGRKLHEHLDYRANVILRDRLTTEKEREKDDGFTKVESRKSRLQLPDDKNARVFSAQTSTMEPVHIMITTKADSMGKR